MFWNAKHAVKTKMFNGAEEVGKGNQIESKNLTFFAVNYCVIHHFSAVKPTCTPEYQTPSDTRTHPKVCVCVCVLGGSFASGCFSQQDGRLKFC